MKSTLITLFALISSLSLRAQTDKKNTVTETAIITVSGAELDKILNIESTDPKIYDVSGKVIDFAKAISMVKSFKYQMGTSKIAGMEGIKNTIFKIDFVQQAEIDQIIRERCRPLSPNLQEGLILDLKPLKGKVNIKELTNKAVLLIFWCDQCYGFGGTNEFESLNEVLSSYMDPANLEILAITDNNIDDASKALLQNPIVNTRHIVDARTVTEAYKTYKQPLIVLADKQHKILYAVKDHNMITPRVVNNIFKEIL